MRSSCPLRLLSAVGSAHRSILNSGPQGRAKHRIFTKEFIMNKLFSILTTIGVAMVLTACASPDAPKHTVLPLDHGPRAQSTPWQNQQRVLRAEQQAKASAEKSQLDANK